MKEEIKNWFEAAKSDLKKAKDNISIGNYDLASFLCQQSAEKALKSYQLKKEKKITKTHDLLFLGKRLNLPNGILGKCKELNPVYIETRYPDANSGFKEYSKEESEEDIKSAEIVLKWTEKKL